MATLLLVINTKWSLLFFRSRPQHSAFPHRGFPFNPRVPPNHSPLDPVLRQTKHNPLCGRCNVCCWTLAFRAASTNPVRRSAAATRARMRYARVRERKKLGQRVWRVFGSIFVSCLHYIESLLEHCFHDACLCSFTRYFLCPCMYISPSQSHPHSLPLIHSHPLSPTHSPYLP